MWYPEKLRLSNFMSHQDSEFIFERGVATMVYGNNKSDEGAVSNGSGKSAILEGICVAMINTSLRLKSTKELVTDGETESTQYLSLYNPVLNRRLEITRTIFSNTKSGKLHILINGEEPKIDLTNVDDGNKEILKEVGIVREDLLNYFLISKEKYEPFLSISDTKKKAIISRFSQATLIDPVFDTLDEKIDGYNEKLEEYEQQQQVIQGKIQVYEQEVTNFSMEGLEKARDEKIAQLKNQHETNKQTIEDRKKDKEDLEPERDALDKELLDLGNIDFGKEIRDLEKSISNVDKNIKEEEVELKGLIQLEVKVRKGLLDAVKCPKCDNEFSLENKKLNIEVARKKHKQIKDAIKESEEWIEKKGEEKIKFKQQIELHETEIRKHNRKKRDLNAQIDTIDNKIYRIDSQISGLEKDNLELTKAIQDVRMKQIEDKRSEYKTAITSLNDEIMGIVDKAEEIIKKKESETLLKETFIKFKTYLANKAIGAIEANANEYLSNTKTNLSIQIDGYKMTRTKKLRENITATILRDGLPAGSYTRLSSGEKARVEIAIIMALQKLINGSVEFGKGLDLTWLDEIIESVDSSGIGGIMKSLNELDQTIVVITHGTFDQVYPYIVSVIKEEDISTIHHGRD